jgi:hypothetical protein
MTWVAEEAEAKGIVTSPGPGRWGREGVLIAAIVCAATLTAVLAVPRVLVAIALAALLSACQLRIGVDIAVDPQGSGVLAVTVGADQELIVRAAEAGADPLAVLAQRGQQLSSRGWQVTETRDERGRSVRLAAGFSGPEEFEALARDLADALAAPEVRLLEPFSLEVADDRLTVRGAASLAPGELVEPGVNLDELVRRAAEEDAVVYEVRVRMPGEVLEANAAAREDGVLVWTVAPGERVDVLAVGERPRALLLPLAAGLLALVAVALIAAVLSRRRRRPEPRAPGRTGA